MGKSSKNGKNISYTWVENNQQEINSILDIGAGSGTYFNLLSKIKIFNWDAVEVWQPYIQKYNLEKKYNKVFNLNIKDYKWEKYYDLVIAGDVLEHLSKEDAIKIVENAIIKSKFILISIPVVHYPQGEINDNPYEIHVKDDWSYDEMIDTFGSLIKKSLIEKDIGVFWLTDK